MERFDVIKISDETGAIALPSVNVQTKNYIENVVIYLVQNDLFNEAYKTPLYMLASSIQQFYEAQDAISEHGLITTNSRGDLMANPAVALQNAARRSALDIMDRFGLNPTAKSKLKLINKEVESKSPIEAFFTDTVEKR